MSADSSTPAGALEKVSSSAFSSGAQLTPEQFSDFVQDVQEQSTVLQRANDFDVEAESGKIPTFQVSTRLLRAVDEAQSTSKVDASAIGSADVPYQTTKVSLPWEMSYEAINGVIDSPEETIRQAFVQQFGADLEALAAVGDESTSGFTAINDGWLTIAESRSGTNTYDHAGGGVDKTLFSEPAQKLPQQYKDNQELVYLASSGLKDAYKEYLTDRSTGAGDAMLMTGDEPTPYGRDILTPLAWPDDTVMLTSMENLAYIVNEDMRVKSTRSSERNVMNDIEIITNLLAQIDYQVLFAEGVALANNTGYTPS